MSKNATNWIHFKSCVSGLPSLWVVWIFLFDLAKMRVLFRGEKDRRALGENLLAMLENPQPRFRLTQTLSSSSVDFNEATFAAGMMQMTIVITIIHPSINPSIHYVYLLIPVQSHRICRNLIQLSSGKRQVNTLDRPPVNHMVIVLLLLIFSYNYLISILQIRTHHFIELLNIWF